MLMTVTKARAAPIRNRARAKVLRRQLKISPKALVLTSPKGTTTGKGSPEDSNEETAAGRGENTAGKEETQGRRDGVVKKELCIGIEGSGGGRIMNGIGIIEGIVMIGNVIGTGERNAVAGL